MSKDELPVKHSGTKSARLAKRSTGSTEDIIVRQTRLIGLYEEWGYEKNQKTGEYLHRTAQPTRKQAVEWMRENGFPTYNNSTFYRDSLQMNRTNAFVRDLTESNYSAMIQKEFETLQELDDQLLEWSKNPPLTTTIQYRVDITKEQDDKGKWIEKQNRIPIFAISSQVSYTEILRMRQSLAQTKAKMLNGEIHTSASLVAPIMEKMKEVIRQKDIEIMKQAEELQLLRKSLEEQLAISNQGR